MLILHNVAHIPVMAGDHMLAKLLLCLGPYSFCGGQMSFEGQHSLICKYHSTCNFKGKTCMKLIN